MTEADGPPSSKTIRRKPFSLGVTGTFAFALLIGILLTYVQAQAVGGINGMLQVGEAATVAPLIEAQLGPVPRSPGSGHDGQIFFAIAIDLDGSVVPDLLDHAGYRYRRILFPATAAGFGLIDGQSIMWMFVAINVLSLAFAAAALSILAREFNRGWWVTMGVVANPGVWLSINTVTSDLMALALALCGLVDIRRGRHWRAIFLLALAALAKDQYLVVAAGAVVWFVIRHRWRTAALYGLAAVPVGIWSVMVDRMVGEGFTPRSNFSFPFLGFIESAENWAFISASDIGYAVVTGFALITGAVLLAVRRDNRSLWPFALPWLAMGVFASSWVWQFGNNALRALAPVILWAIFAAAPVRTYPTANTPS